MGLLFIYVIFCANIRKFCSMIVESFVFFEKNPFPPTIQNGSRDAGVRYYKSEKMGKDVLALYVFVKPSSNSDMDAFCRICVKNLNENYPVSRQELQSKSQNDLDLQYKVYLLNVLLN